MIRSSKALCPLLLAPAALAQTVPTPPSGLPLDLRIPAPVVPVVAGGVTHLTYELHVSNFSPQGLELAALQVLAEGSEAAPLATYRGETLAGLLLNPAGGASAAQPLGPGSHHVLFLDVQLPGRPEVPRGLRHRLTLQLKRPDGQVVERSLEGGPVAVSPRAARVLQAPLRGDHWLVYDLLDNLHEGHRRTLMAVNGRAAIAQRFAIDWVKLGPDGRLFRDPGNVNANWYDYGAEVLAVADGVVASVKEGFPDNAAQAAPTIPITLESIGGNALGLDLGGGHFAFYGHLKPGSLRVKVGDRVKAGQVLAQLGNSGQSDGPHLHFHLVDGNSLLGAEGVPYVFERFTFHGTVTDPAKVVEAGQPWQPPAGQKPTQHQRELPGNLAVVSFP